MIGERVIMAIKAGVTAFRESYFDADTQDWTDDAAWIDFDARRTRYAVQWAFFQGNAYRDIHNWSKKMRGDYGLYKYTRDLYNPAFRLGSFYRSYLWGGRLDMKAGDGKERPSALPIIIPESNQANADALRMAISQLWQWSNWKTARKIIPLHGSTIGDAFISVVDDRMREKVYLQYVHPGQVAHVMKDPFGNIKEYVIAYNRDDPESKGKDAEYQEHVYRDDSGDVVYQLLKDGNPYHWGTTDKNGNQIDTWTESYGFIPMVHVQHFDIGLDWGMSELFPKLALFRDIDDLGSKLNDQIRKYVDAPWLFAGVKKPDTQPTTTGATSGTTRPEPGREEVPALYSNDPQAKAQALVANLDLAAVSDKLQNDLRALESDYPELALIRAMNKGGDLSGVAIELLQRQSGEKIADYRDSYDDALVRAQQMAIAIAGENGYEGFEGFGLDSFVAGDLDHQIGERDVFSVTTTQQLSRRKLEAEAQQAAKNAGWDILSYIKAHGGNEETIKIIEESPMYQAQLSMLQMGLQAANGDEG